MKSEEMQGFEAYEAYNELEEEFNAPWADFDDNDGFEGEKQYY